jgi:ABC-type multidrug transport system ATPase subunit
MLPHYKNDYINQSQNINFSSSIKVKGHIVAGNRLRMLDSLELNGDTQWVSSLSEKQKRRVLLISQLMMKRLGYE